MRVLVIDDKDDCAFLLGELVKSRGCASLYCTMPTQAIDIAKEWQPNVILLDLFMPGMDGYQLAPKLREVGHRVVPRIFLVSGCIPDREKLTAATIDGYLLKPVRLQEMTDLLQDEGLIRYGCWTVADWNRRCASLTAGFSFADHALATSVSTEPVR